MFSSFFAWAKAYGYFLTRLCNTNLYPDDLDVKIIEK